MVSLVGTCFESHIYAKRGKANHHDAPFLRRRAIGQNPRNVVCHVLPSHLESDADP